MTMTEKVLKEDIPHGDFWVVFTPDEEIGRGSDHFDFDICKADYGYTVDGDYEGEVAYENFNAASAKVTVHGFSIHPGGAKNKMLSLKESWLKPGVFPHIYVASRMLCVERTASILSLRTASKMMRDAFTEGRSMVEMISSRTFVSRYTFRLFLPILFPQIS